MRDRILLCRRCGQYGGDDQDVGWTCWTCAGKLELGPERTKTVIYLSPPVQKEKRQRNKRDDRWGG